MIVDKAIVDGVQNVVYPEMDKVAGNPAGHFANLKRRQSTLIQMEEALKDQTKALSTRTAKMQGAPRASRENVSVYASHATQLPGFSAHRIQNIFIKPNPQRLANSAVWRAFNERPTSIAAIYSLPVRTLLFQPPDLPVVENRRDALQLLGR